jgi:hypothetical protein
MIKILIANFVVGMVLILCIELRLNGLIASGKLKDEKKKSNFSQRAYNIISGLIKVMIPVINIATLIWFIFVDDEDVIKIAKKTYEKEEVEG